MKEEEGSGEKKGKIQGIAEGETKRNKEMIKAMHKKGIAIETMIEISGLKKEEIEKIIKEET